MSVVVPTYNRSDHLRATLRNLGRQRMPADQFEVVVADDGSSDDTRAVVEEASGTLRTRYHFQPDEGFRAGTARNGGARLAAAPILVFLDTGVFIGPDFLQHHLAAHATPDPVAVVGHAYAYRISGEVMPGLAEALAEMAPEQAVARFRGRRRFSDPRHVALTACDFDLGRLVAPWVHFWTLNCSVRADDFWRVGGFDEDFRGWGLDDLELGWRLFKAGVGIRHSGTAWAVHAPHPRDMAAIWTECLVNLRRFLAVHPEPAAELVWKLLHNGGDLLLDLEENLRFLAGWTDQTRQADIAAELVGVLPQVPPGPVAVFGAGSRLPAELAGAVPLDFDAAAVAGLGTGHHAIGIRTPLPDQAVDAVILTSRLAGLWPRWGADILAEARRVGGSVHLTAGLAREAAADPALR